LLSNFITTVSVRVNKHVIRAKENWLQVVCIQLKIQVKFYIKSKLFFNTEKTKNKVLDFKGNTSINML